MASSTPSVDDAYDVLQAGLTSALANSYENLRKFETFQSEYLKLKKTLETISGSIKYDVMVPFGPLAFMPGQLVHTNEITALLGDNWFAKTSAKDAAGIVDRRIEYVCEKLEEARKEIALMEQRSSLTGDLFGGSSSFASAESVVSGSGSGSGDPGAATLKFSMRDSASPGFDGSELESDEDIVDIREEIGEEDDSSDLDGPGNERTVARASTRADVPVAVVPTPSPASTLSGQSTSKSSASSGGALVEGAGDSSILRALLDKYEAEERRLGEHDAGDEDRASAATASPLVKGKGKGKEKESPPVMVSPAHTTSPTTTHTTSPTTTHTTSPPVVAAPPAAIDSIGAVTIRFRHSPVPTPTEPLPSMPPAATVDTGNPSPIASPGDILPMFLRDSRVPAHSLTIDTAATQAATSTDALLSPGTPRSKRVSFSDGSLPGASKEGIALSSMPGVHAALDAALSGRMSVDSAAQAVLGSFGLGGTAALEKPKVEGSEPSLDKQPTKSSLKGSSLASPRGGSAPTTTPSATPPATNDRAVTSALGKGKGKSADSGTKPNSNPNPIHAPNPTPAPKAAGATRESEFVPKTSQQAFTGVIVEKDTHDAQVATDLDFDMRQVNAEYTRMKVQRNG
eukprot:Opistho-2@80419